MPSSLPMDRRETLLRGIDKTMHGVEIAPFYTPLVPKRDGWNVLILDVFDNEHLLGVAKEHGLDPARIEEVDIVGSACDIGQIDGGPFDYIVSSHNFEHLPDPVRFLQGVENKLAPQGTLRMAIPDCRATFDAFRPLTTTGDWLEWQGRTAPGHASAFEFAAYYSEFLPFQQLKGTVEAGRAMLESGEYRDVHCTIACPSSFELLVTEARALGLTALSLDWVVRRRREFLVSLTRKSAPDADVEAQRQSLLKAIRKEMRRGPPLGMLAREAVRQTFGL